MPDYLDFDFKTPPFTHQLRELEEHGDDVARAMAWTMRTGKTKTVIDKACYLYKRGKIDGLLIIAPNGVHLNWLEREIPLHMWDSVAHEMLGWRSAVVSAKAGNRLGMDKSLAWAIDRETWYNDLKAGLRTDKLSVLAIATETMIRDDVRKAVARFIKWRKVLVVVDECDDFGTPGATRTKMLRAIVKRCPYRVIMSGTMADSSPLALWSQYELLAPGALGCKKYESFKLKYGVYEMQSARGQTFPKLTGFQRLPDLRKRTAQWTSVVLRDDVNMSKLIHESIYFEATDDQKTAYAELRESFLLDLAGDRVSVGERAPRFQKMQQVFSGFVNDLSGRRHLIPGGNPRLDATAHQCFLAPGKFIVWCEYQADIDMVVARLKKMGMRVLEYHGRVSDTDKQKVRSRFNTDPDVDGVVGQVVAGARGFDMSGASTIINHSHTFKARMRKQARERASKIGGGPVRFIDIVGPGPDRHVLKTTNNRINVADSLVGSGLRALLKRMRL